MLSLEVSCVKKNNHLKIASEHTILTRVSRLLAEWKIKTWKMKNCNPEVISVNPGLAKHALPFFLWLEVEIRNFYTNSGFAYSNNLTQNRQHWMVLSVKKQLGWDLQDKNSVLWGGFFFFMRLFLFYRVCTIRSVDGSNITSYCVHECDASSRMGSRPRRFLITGHSNGCIQVRNYEINAEWFFAVLKWVWNHNKGYFIGLSQGITDNATGA